MGAFTSALISGAGQGVSGAVTGGVSSLIDFGLGQIAARKQYKNQKKLMKMSHEYELENMATQDQYQRNLMVDANRLQKQSLQNAGYSTADPNGTGFEAPNMSMPGTSASGSAAMGQVPSTAANYSALMSGEYNASVARLNDIEAQYRAKELEGRIGLYKEQIAQIKETLPQQVALLKEQVQKVATDKKLSQKHIEQFGALISKLEAETKGINIDNNYKDQLNEKTINKLASEASLLWKQGKVEAVKAKLADYGILVGADWFTTLASILATGHEGDLSDLVISKLKEFFGGMPTTAKSIFDTILENSPAYYHDANRAGSFIGGLKGKVKD